MSPEQSVRETVTSEDGLLTFRRETEQVQLIASYRDPDQTEQLPLPVTSAAVGHAVNAMRRRASTHMETVLMQLFAQLEPRLSHEGMTDDFVDPTFGPFVPIPEVSLSPEGVLTVGIDRFSHTVDLNTVAGLSDAHVAENLLRAVMAERDRQLHRVFEEVRRQLVLGLGHETEPGL